MNTPDHRPTFSIVIGVHDQAEEIEQNLPSLLTQQFEGGYEVIVVDESSTDETVDVLKRLKSNHPYLYTTFLPKYHFQNNRRRLAFTLGVKAAKYQWVIFIDISTPPPSEGWLQELAENLSPSTELLLGYIHRKSGEMRLQAFGNIDEARSIVNKAERSRANGHGGHWLRYLRGKYDFLVVRTRQGHDALRLFDRNVRGLRLLEQRVGIFFHNLYH